MRFYWPIAKVDGEQHMVWGYASTEAEDDQGESVMREALAAALDDYMRFANIREMHQPSAVGVARQAGIDDKGLYVGAKIVDADAWMKVVEGVYKGFSIGGRVTARDPADRRIITGLRLSEISLVDRPANPEAVFDCWKRAATPDPEPDTADAARAGPEYADPGFQPDGRERYPLDSERHIRAAWAYIHQPHNARRYTADQLAHIRGRIVAAWRARIDPAGPPAAGSRKSLSEAARLAQIILDLDGICDDIAGASAGEAGAPPAERLQQIVSELCDFLVALIAGESAEPADVGALPAAARLAAMAGAGALRKARRGPDPWPDPAPIAGELARLAQEIVPRLEALQKRVDAIAATPLPPQTASRGLSAVAKRDDGGGLADEGDVVAALARMSAEERTLALIKAAHQSPIAPFGRPR